MKYLLINSILVSFVFSSCATKQPTMQKRANTCFGQLEKVNSFLDRRPDKANMAFLLLAEANPSRPVVGNCHLVPGYIQAWHQLSAKAQTTAQRRGQSLNRARPGLR